MKTPCLSAVIKALAIVATFSIPLSRLVAESFSTPAADESAIELRSASDETEFDSFDLDIQDDAQTLGKVFRLGQCRGVARPCAIFQTGPSCRAQDGCRWANFDCRGVVRSCRSVTTAAKCNRMSGCRWAN